MSDYSYLVTDLVNAVEALTKENEDLRAKRVVEREALESRIVVYRAERDALRAQVSDLQVRYQDLWSEGRAVRDERRALQAQLDSMTKGGEQA